MAVAYANSNTQVTANYSGGSGTLTVNPPASIASGDLWFVNVSSHTSNAAGAHSQANFTQAYQNLTNSKRASGWWRIAGASESNQGFSIASATYIVHGTSMRFTGTHQTAPIGNTARSTYNNSVAPVTTLDSGTVTVNSSRAMVIAHSTGTPLTGGQGLYAHSPSDMTEVYSYDQNATGGIKVTVGYLARASGSFSPNDYTFEVALVYIESWLTVILPPAPSPSETRYARPEFDVSNGAWVPSTGGSLYPLIDEVDADDADYIRISGAGSQIGEVLLTSLVDPHPDHQGHIVRFRAKAEVAATSTIRVSLRQGDSTEIGTWDQLLTTSYVTYTKALTPTEASNISDYTDLRLRFEYL